MENVFPVTVNVILAKKVLIDVLLVMRIDILMKMTISVKFVMIHNVMGVQIFRMYVFHAKMDITSKTEEMYVYNVFLLVHNVRVQIFVIYAMICFFLKTNNAFHVKTLAKLAQDILNHVYHVNQGISYKITTAFHVKKNV